MYFGDPGGTASGPDENRDAILSFIDAHTGVEAFVEPRT